MAVVNVKKMWSVSSGDRDTTGRSITEGWTVLFDTPANASTYKAGTAPGIPVRGESHSEDIYLRAKRRRVRALSPFLYQVEWTYEMPASTSLHEDGQDPLDQPTQYERETVVTQDVMTRDAEGKIVADTNGREFDPPIMDDIYDTALTLTKNYAAFSEATANAYSGAINSDTFNGNPPGTCKILGISARRVTEGDLLYWNVSVRIGVRTPKVPGETADKVWYRRVLNQGFYYRNAPTDAPSAAVRAKDPEGNPSVKPVLLKEDGTLQTDLNNPHWLYFRSPHSKLLPFADLNLV